MATISQRTLAAWERFAAEVEAFRAETDEPDFAVLYEDAYTRREVKDFKMTKTGILTWIEEGKKEREVMYDDQDAKDWLKFWRGCLRKAKRYWAMDTETLDAIYDGEKEDINEEEDD